MGMNTKKNNDTSVGGALRYDGEKLNIALIPVECITAIAEVFTFGAEKYERDNWRKGMAWSRSYNSAMRHLLAFWQGENNDVESGLSHLAHAMVNLIFLYWYTLFFKQGDDRPKIKRSRKSRKATPVKYKTCEAVDGVAKTKVSQGQLMIQWDGK